MPVADRVKGRRAAADAAVKPFPIIHVCFERCRVIKRHKLQLTGIPPMLRLALAIAIAAPLLSGCIIIATDKPTTRVVQTAPADAQ
jgi:hypothetical protein